MTDQALDVLVLTLFTVISAIGGYQTPDHTPNSNRLRPRCFDE